MTRINVGYPVKKLSRQHLLAEHREIKRIPNMISSGRANINNIPEKFCLGTGHVKFFYDKIGYLHNRYLQIRRECLRRKYKVDDYSSAFLKVQKELFNDWEPTEEDKALIVERINERLKNK